MVCTKEVVSLFITLRKELFMHVDVWVCLSNIMASILWIQQCYIEEVIILSYSSFINSLSEFIKFHTKKANFVRKHARMKMICHISQRSVMKELI